MKNELISIIAPCYNVADTLERYLKSILNQTYKHIEVIAVDDGSTDDTADILNRYCSVFAANKMTLKYLYEDNAGLGAAINTGLKYVTGDYLCWSDPDDFYFPASMEKRLQAFHEHPECAVVSSDAYVYHADDLEHPIKREAARFTYRQEPNQFELLLKEESHFCAGCHMVRMAEFEEVNPEREIYPARRGQNWQLLLPVYYRYPRYFLEEPLYGYVLYPQSMSTGDVTEEKVMLRWDEHETILLETLQKIQMSSTEHETYRHMVVTRYAKKRFYSAIDFRDKKTMTEQYQILCGLQENTEDIQKLFFRNRNVLCKAIGKLISSIKK